MKATTGWASYQKNPAVTTPPMEGKHQVVPADSALVAQAVKNLPAMQETRVQSLGQEDPWKRKWQPIPVLFPGEFHGQRSLVSYSPWGHKELDTTVQLTLSR